MRRLPALLALVLGLPACSYSFSSLSFESENWKHKASRSEEVNLDFHAGEALWFDVRYAAIDVRASNVETPHLVTEITIRGKTEAEAQKHLDQVAVDCVHTSRGLEIRLTGQPIENVVESGGHRRITTKFWATAKFRAIVPERTPLNVRTRTGSTLAAGPLGPTDVRTRYGAVTVSGVDGNVNLESYNGKLALEHCDGRTVQLATQHGSIDLDTIATNKCSAHTRSGSIVAENVKATVVDLESRYGKIDASGIRGSFEATTNSGSLTLEGQTGGDVRLTTTYGAITVKGATAEVLDATTRNGAVRLEDVRGDVAAQSKYGNVFVRGALATVKATSGNGTVEVDAEPGSKPDANWSIVSTYGSLTLHVPQGFSAGVRATTRYGNVDTEIPIVVQGKVGRQTTLTGQIGVGGPTVRMDTRNGSIFIKRR